MQHARNLTLDQLFLSYGPLIYSLFWDLIVSALLFKTFFMKLHTNINYHYTTCRMQEP